MTSGSGPTLVPKSARWVPRWRLAGARTRPLSGWGVGLAESVPPEPSMGWAWKWLAACSQMRSRLANRTIGSTCYLGPARFSFLLLALVLVVLLSLLLYLLVSYGTSAVSFFNN